VRLVLCGIKRPAVGPSVGVCDNKAMYDLVVKDGASSRTRYFERATILIKYAIMKLIVVVDLVTRYGFGQAPS